MTAASDALARMRDTDTDRGRGPRERHLLLKLDDGRSLQYPSPARLARVFALPALREWFDMRKASGALITRPAGSDGEFEPVMPSVVAEHVRRCIEQLPDRADAGRPYRDLRAFVADAKPPTVTAYLLETARCIQQHVTPWKAPRGPRHPAKSVAERQRDHMAARRADEIETARWWLEQQTAPDDEGAVRYPPGQRVRGSELYAAAVADLEGIRSGCGEGEEWEDFAEAEEVPVRFRVPGRRHFYEVVAEFMDRSTGRGGAIFFTLRRERGVTQ